MSASSAAPNPEIAIAHRVLVLGGTGFIGRHVVAALHAAGAQVLIGSRQPARHEQDFPHAKFRQTRFENLHHHGAWTPLINGVDVVINCVGILRQRPNESYDGVHHRAPAALAIACARENIRLIHTSALGLHEGAASRFLSSKLLGEHAVKGSGCQYSIVRPSLLDGEGGFGAAWLRGLSRSPIHLIPRAARGKIAAMTATDLGDAIAALAAMPSTTVRLSSAARIVMNMPSICAPFVRITLSQMRYKFRCQIGSPASVRMYAMSCISHRSPTGTGYYCNATMCHRLIDCLNC